MAHRNRSTVLRSAGLAVLITASALLTSTLADSTKGLLFGMGIGLLLLSLVPAGKQNC